MYFNYLDKADPEISAAIKREMGRQETKIEMIASENFVNFEIMEAMGSALTNKYAEGYPGKRYYGGCEFVDQVETLAIERAKALFGAEHANVQPHCGANANTAVYQAVLEYGDPVLGMDLSNGGHLSHDNTKMQNIYDALKRLRNRDIEINNEKMWLSIGFCQLRQAYQK